MLPIVVEFDEDKMRCLRLMGKTMIDEAANLRPAD